MTNLSILSKQIRLHDGLYSLNDLHKAAGSEGKHRPDRFLRLEQTQDLITEINSCPDMGNSFKTLRGIGSFGCKELVYAYAMWISPKFHLQVIRAFDAQQQLAITKEPTPLDYQRIMLTIENGQTTHTQGQQHHAELLPKGGAVHAGSFQNFVGNVLEVRIQHPHHDGQV